MKKYSGLDRIPNSVSPEKLTEGCLVLEGGAWKGVYTVGVLDFLLENGINFDTVIGVSAGALSGMGYLTGIAGWSARIDLAYRHDPRYCGILPLFTDKGVTGFSYLFDKLMKKEAFDEKRYNDPAQRLIVAATNMLTGKMEYFEKGKCDLNLCVRASATVPYVSKPVMINGVPYLDGGCSDKIPYRWAKENGQRNIIVVKTRERSFRRKEEGSAIARAMYRKYPDFLRSFEGANRRFNLMCEEMEEEEKKGNIFIMAPSEKVEVTRFEGDMEKLGELYWLGHGDMEREFDRLKAYLAR